MSVIDVNFVFSNNTGVVYIVTDDNYTTITQAGYLDIELLTNKSIDYTDYNIFMVQWLGNDSRGHVQFFNPVLDETSGNITLASYF